MGSSLHRLGDDFVSKNSVRASLSYSPGGFGGFPIIAPMSVDTQPGQHALMIRPGLSRARTAVKALMQALLTLYAF